jgi:hypothetical protein
VEVTRGSQINETGSLIHYMHSWISGGNQALHLLGLETLLGSCVRKISRLLEIMGNSRLSQLPGTTRLQRGWVDNLQYIKSEDVSFEI